jgi:hypothetical protein
MRANIYLPQVTSYSLYYEAVADHWDPPSKTPAEIREVAKGIVAAMYEVNEPLTFALHWQARGLKHES